MVVELVAWLRCDAPVAAWLRLGRSVRGPVALRELRLFRPGHRGMVTPALERLIDGGELSLRAIDDFIMRSKSYPTARYLSGIANYLYGVLAREGAAESRVRDESHDGGGYQGKYDQAVGILGSFDRPPAEAICGAYTQTSNQHAAPILTAIGYINWWEGRGSNQFLQLALEADPDYRLARLSDQMLGYGMIAAPWNTDKNTAHRPRGLEAS